MSHETLKCDDIEVVLGFCHAHNVDYQPMEFKVKSLTSKDRPETTEFEFVEQCTDAMVTSGAPYEEAAAAAPKEQKCLTFHLNISHHLLLEFQQVHRHCLAASNFSADDVTAATS